MHKRTFNIVFDYTGRTQCWLDFAYSWQWKVYMTSVACAVFIIPALIIIICYTVIVCTIWSKSSTIVIINPHQRRKSTRGTRYFNKPENDFLKNWVKFFPRIQENLLKISWKSFKNFVKFLKIRVKITLKIVWNFPKHCLKFSRKLPEIF